MEKVKLRCLASFAGTDMETGETMSGYGGQEIEVSPAAAQDLIRAGYAELAQDKEPAPEPTADEAEAETDPASLAEEPAPEPTADEAEAETDPAEGDKSVSQEPAPADGGESAPEVVVAKATAKTAKKPAAKVKD